MSREKLRSVPPMPQGGVLLGKVSPKPDAPPSMRRFSILLVGSTDGFRLQLEPPQAAGVSALEATAILARIAGAGLGPIQQVPPAPRPESGTIADQSDPGGGDLG